MLAAKPRVVRALAGMQAGPVKLRAKRRQGIRSAAACKERKSSQALLFHKRRDPHLPPQRVAAVFRKINAAPESQQAVRRSASARAGLRPALDPCSGPG